MVSKRTCNLGLFHGGYKALIANFYNLRRILIFFYLYSGLKVNFSKCKLFGVGVGPVQISTMASIVHCHSTSFPFPYLELPVGANMELIKNMKLVVEVQQKIIAMEG